MEIDIPDNIEVYYLDKKFGKHYMFIAENVIYTSDDSVVYPLREYAELFNKGELNGWVTFRKKREQTTIQKKEQLK